jgi:hypothetical protein
MHLTATGGGLALVALIVLTCSSPLVSPTIAPLFIPAMHSQAKLPFRTEARLGLCPSLQMQQGFATTFRRLARRLSIPGRKKLPPHPHRSRSSGSC